MKALIDYPLQAAAKNLLASSRIGFILAPHAHAEPVIKFVETLPPADREEIEILVGDAFQVKAKLCSLLPNLRWVHHFAAGLSDARTLDWEWIESAGIAISTSKIQSISVSELAIALLLSLAKKLPYLLESQHRKIYDSAMQPDILAGKTALVVGAGNIGSTIGKRLANGLGMRVLGVNDDGAQLPDFEDIGTLADIGRFLPQADAVILACPLTEATRGIIDSAKLRLMKSSAYLINVARGQLVVQSALVEALNAGRIAGAALDVLEKEPPSKNDEIWQAKNLILTPHIAGNNQDYGIGLVNSFLKNLPFFLKGHPESMPSYANVKRY